MGRPLKSIKPMFQRGLWRIVRGDLVRIIAGRCKGEHGQVLTVIRDPRRPRVIVEGHNLIRRRLPARNGQPGFTVTIEAPLHYSNVMLADPTNHDTDHNGKPIGTPVRSKLGWHPDTGFKFRSSKGRRASCTTIAMPEAWRAQALVGDSRVGAKDTPPEAALKLTFDPSKDFSDFSAGWPASGGHRRTQQRSFSTASTSSSSGHVRGFAASAAEASAAEDAGCSHQVAYGGLEQQAWRLRDDAGSDAGTLMMQRRYNPVLQLARRMQYYSSSSGNGRNGSSSRCEAACQDKYEPVQHSGVGTAPLPSEVREPAGQQAGGRGAAVASRWLQSWLSKQ